MSGFLKIPLTELCRPRQWPTIGRTAMSEEGEFPVYGANGLIGRYTDYNHEVPTILIGCRGSCGSLHMTDGKVYVTGNAMALNDLKERTIDRKYLFRFLESRGFKDVTTGTSQPQITGSSLSKLDVFVPQTNGKPDLDEQKRIAAILDKADDIRRKRQEALRLTDDFLRSVFLDLFGDPVTNPKGWEILSLDELVGGSFRNGLSPSTRGTVEGEVLTLTAITTGTFEAKHVKSALFDRSPSENQRVTRDTFLICRGNGNPQLVGTGVFPTTDLAAVAFPDTMIACTVNRSQIEPLFLQSIWAHPHVRRQIEAGARTTNGTYKVNQTVLGSISFPVPPLSEQTRFSLVARKSLENRKQLDDSAAEAELLFSSLQQRAFRGEL